MKKIEQILDYFLTLKGSLNQKKYCLHYFLDLLFCIVVMLLLTAIAYILLINDAAKITIFEIRLPILFFAVSAILLMAFLAMNRLSIMIRRLNYLKMNKAYALLVFFPFVGLLFDVYLIAHPDHNPAEENKV